MSETPIEDFIREAAVWVEKDGQTYFEMVMSTVHELERRFTAERRRADSYAEEQFQHIKKLAGIIQDLEDRLQEAERREEGLIWYKEWFDALSGHGTINKVRENWESMEKEVERLKEEKETLDLEFDIDHAEMECRIKELEAKLEEKESDLRRVTDNSRYIYMGDRIKELEAENERLKSEHISGCMFHRCSKHVSVRQINTKEFSGAECGACIQEDMKQKDVNGLPMHLRLDMGKVLILAKEKKELEAKLEKHKAVVEAVKWAMRTHLDMSGVHRYHFPDITRNAKIAEALTSLEGDKGKGGME